MMNRLNTGLVEVLTGANSPLGRIRRATLTWVMVGLAALLLSGCFAGRPDRNASDLALLLPFLENARTTKEEALLHLGQPSAQFEGEHILTYRMADTPEGGLDVASRLGTGGWKTAKYSLVLVFDDRQLLLRHNLVRVR